MTDVGFAAPSLKDQEFPDEEDWRNTLPSHMRECAKLYGRDLFTTAYNIGAIQEAIGILQRRIRGNRELEHITVVLANSSNKLAMSACARFNFSPEQIREVQHKIEIATALAMAGTSTSGNRIILPS